jgi:hypothetical protein
MFWTPGNRFGPEKKPAHGPLSLLTEPVRCSGLPLADVWVPLVGPRQSSSTSGHQSRQRPSTFPRYSSLIPINHPAVSSPHHAYKSPQPPLPFPLPSLAQSAARLPELLAGVRSLCKHFRSIPTPSGEPRLSLHSQYSPLLPANRLTPPFDSTRS